MRVVAAGVPAKGTVIHSSAASSARCALTSENVTCTALASSNGASVIMTLRFPDLDGPLGEPHAATETPRAMDKAAARRITVSSLEAVAQELDHGRERL